MKTFTAKFFLLFAILCIIVFCLEYRYKSYLSHADIVFNKSKPQFSKVTKLYIGGSHTGVIGNYTNDSNQTAINLSFQGFDLFKICYVLKKNLPLMPNLKKVYIGIDYELIGLNQTLSGEEYLDRQFYQYMDTMYRDNFTNRLMAKSNFFRSNRDLSYLISKYDNQIQLEKTTNFIPFTNNPDNEFDCKKRSLEHSSIKFKSKLIQENLNFLAEIINLAKNQHVSLVLFNPPKRKCFTDHSHKINIQLGKQKIESLLSSTKTHYFDFYNDTSFNDSDFSDYDHLNSTGIDKMMKKLP